MGQGQWQAEMVGVVVVALTVRVTPRERLRLSRFDSSHLCHQSDGVRLRAMISTLGFHYKMRGPLKKRDSGFGV